MLTEYAKATDRAGTKTTRPTTRPVREAFSRRSSTPSSLSDPSQLKPAAAAPRRAHAMASGIPKYRSPTTIPPSLSCRSDRGSRRSRPPDRTQLLQQSRARRLSGGYLPPCPQTHTDGGLCRPPLHDDSTLCRQAVISCRSAIRTAAILSWSAPYARWEKPFVLVLLRGVDALHVAPYYWRAAISSS